MKDKSKRLTVVNTGKKPSEKKEVQQIVVQPSSSSSSHAPGFNPNLYLLKSVWDSVFEIKTDVSGQKYIFGKLPVVTKYGITMYADDGNVDIPQLAEGLPYDQRTIWFNPETKQIEVIGGTGGGEGGVSNFWDLSGIPSWITNAKPSYNYSEIKNTPDLSVFVTGTALSNTLANYATLSYLTGELKKYVTLDGAQDITGIKDFINGLKIGGIELIKKQDDVVYLDANLVVRGGITMYGDGEGGSSVPLYSTLGSLLNVDESNDAVASVDRVLFQSAGSNVWSWKALSEIGGGSVSGDYLPLSGGTITGNLLIKQPVTTPVVGFIGSANSGTSYYYYGYLGFETQNNPIFMNSQGSTYSLLHAGNYTYYTLPLSGGTLKGNTPYTLNLDTTNTTEIWETLYLNGEQKAGLYYNISNNVGLYSYVSNSYMGMKNDGSPYIRIGNNWNTILHSGNIANYNAGSATKLQTARAIWGQSFDGTSNISGKLTVSGIGGWAIEQKKGDSYVFSLGSGSASTSAGTENGILQLYQNGSEVIRLYAASGESSWINSAKLGIGTTNPAYMLDVRGNACCSYMSFYNTSGTNEAGWIGRGSTSTNHIGLYASTGNNVVMYAGGYLCVTLTNQNALFSGGITMYSDQRKKTILNHVELSLKQIADAPLIEHYYNSDQEKTTHVGSIAQYWAGLNDWFCKLDAEGFYTMEIQNCALASAISIARHLEKYESKTDKKIRMLKKRVQELEDKLEKLEGGKYGCN